MYLYFCEHDFERRVFLSHTLVPFMTRVQPGGPRAVFLLPKTDIIPCFFSIFVVVFVFFVIVFDFFLIVFVSLCFVFCIFMTRVKRGGGGPRAVFLPTKTDIIPFAFVFCISICICVRLYLYFFVSL